jgi:hypothetical protein
MDNENNTLLKESRGHLDRAKAAAKHAGELFLLASGVEFS